jgi:hypothetical protein
MRVGSVGVTRELVAASLHPQAQAPARRPFRNVLAPQPPRPTPAPRSPSFDSRVSEMAGRLHVRASDLMAIMRFESGLRPDAVNPSTHAVGLIQFLPRTAGDLRGLPPGMPGRERRAVEAFASMSADEQLDYVEAYFEKVLGGRGAATSRDAYMAVLFPSAVGRGDGFVIARADGEGAFERAVYRQNAPLDVNGDGVITAAEAASRAFGVRG